MKAVNALTGELVDVPVQPFSQVLRPAADFSDEVDSKPAVAIEPYLPPQIRIADMMEAGVRLQESRKARYDSDLLAIEEGEDVPLDPTRQPGVDMVDIQRAAEKANAALKATQQTAAEAAAAKAKADAEAADQKRIEAAAEALLAARSKVSGGA